MGWTWKDRYSLLQLYPTLATAPVLLDRWPGLKTAVAELEMARRDQELLNAQAAGTVDQVSKNPD